MLASRGMDMRPLERKDSQTLQLQFPPRTQDVGIVVSWLSRLQNQGLLESSRSDDQSEEDNGTELAMYKRFLSSAFPRPPPQTDEQRSEVSKVAASGEDNFSPEHPSIPGVLSTLTRTESKRFPDGRVEIKTVLIKRFADGGETITETVRTNHENTESSQGKDDKQIAKEEKKGWFWN